VTQIAEISASVVQYHNIFQPARVEYHRNVEISATSPHVLGFPVSIVEYTDVRRCFIVYEVTAQAIKAKRISQGSGSNGRYLQVTVPSLIRENSLKIALLG